MFMHVHAPLTWSLARLLLSGHVRIAMPSATPFEDQINTKD